MGDYEVRVPSQLTALLRAIRRQRGLTQKELARKMGLTQQALSQLERNASAASFLRIAKYCRTLGVTLVLRDASGPAGTPTGGGW